MFAGLALPCLVMMCCGTSLAATPGSALTNPLLKIVGIVIALALAILVLWITARLHRSTPDPNNTAAALYPFSFVKGQPSSAPVSYLKPVEPLLSYLLPPRLQPGILDSRPDPEAPHRLRSGHGLAMITVAILLVIYAVGFVYSPSYSLSQYSPAAMFYLLFLLIFLTWLFSGIAFFLDAVRVPVLTTMLVASMIAGSIQGTDHQFTVRKPVDPGAGTIPPTPAEVVDAWMKARGKNDPHAPMVIVATAGGGIRASAWTTQVLTGLSNERVEAPGVDFDASLVLVSSVSGGSVGNMYVVGSYDEGGKLQADDGSRISDAASRTSLSSVGWGLLYPDVLRTIPVLGSFVPQDRDRGWALERAWLSNWAQRPPDPQLTMASWIQDVRHGTRPAAIFNTTIAETGQRFLISSTEVPAFHEEDSDITKKHPDRHTLQFATEFPGYDMDVQTAARASATFPWVSPMARPAAEPRADTLPIMHLADGGYYDNSGVMSATQWLVGGRDTIKPRSSIQPRGGRSSDRLGPGSARCRHPSEPFSPFVPVPNKPAPTMNWSWHKNTSVSMA